MSTIADLTKILSVWIRRLRIQRAAKWSLRGLIVGLALSVVFGFGGMILARLLRDEFLTLVASMGIVSSVASGLVAYFWPVKPIEAARHFDLEFHLNERVSAALELSADNSIVPDEIIRRQLDDALAVSRKVNPIHDLPLKFRTREVIPVLVLIGLLSLAWFRGGAWFQAAQKARVVEQSIAQQIEQIEEALQQIQTNQALTEEQKRILSAPLNDALEALQNTPTLEGSVSALSNAAEKMQALSNQELEQNMQALKEAGEKLAQQKDSPLQSVGEKLSQGDLQGAANELKNLDTSKMSAEEKQKLVDDLRQAADSLQETNPQLSSELNDAADALEKGDTAAANESLDNAATSMSEAGQPNDFSQTAQQNADQLQNGADQVMAAGGSQTDQSQQASAQTGNSNQNGESASGSGTGSGSNEPKGKEASDSPIAQNNGSGDGGETSYEQIDSSSLLGGEDKLGVGLSSDQQDGDVIGTSPTTSGSSSDSTVPYEEVYGEYDQANQQAIDNGAVPFQFLQIVKNYFDSLEP